jgi:hypothetical protein
MIKINNQEFKNESVIEVIKSINEYLKEEKLILVNNEGIPLCNEKVNNILANNTDVNFIATSFAFFEKETIKETLSYVKKVIDEVNKIINLDLKVNLLSVITDLLEGIEDLIIIEKNYYIKNFEKLDVQKISLEILSEYESGNENHILDILEFELLPLYIKLEALLKERELQHELSDC